MPVLSYNDACVGLDRCELNAFHPRDCASQDVDARPRAKHLEQGHIADHVFERVSSAYADFRSTAHSAARKRYLRRAASAEEGSAAKRQAASGEAEEALTAAIAAAPPTATAAEGLVAPAVGKVIPASLQPYLKDRIFGKRMLPPWDDLPGKPDGEVKRYTNRKTAGGCSCQEAVL